MNRKLNPVVLAGAVLALAGVAFLAVLAARGGGSSSDKTLSVLVTTVPVAAGTPAAGASLAVKQVAASSVPPGALTDASAVSNQVALRALAKGEVVVPGTFGTQGVAASGGVVLPDGKEGLGVELGFAPGGLRYVVPGNRITVWSTLKGESTRMLLNDVQVIATTPGAGDGAATAVTAGPGNLDFLLALSRQEAARVITAQAGGATLYFTLAGTGQKS
ncbi:MAG TPA: SAF domain-containing protein [Mycobacteriales bacterium]|nr:SAF domain-containing protein [Mycobacteriales bacterium]